MSQEPEPSRAAGWMCLKCEVPLESSKVGVSYLGSTFPVDLLRCPRCGLTMIPEELALGKMAEVEKLLEDK
ncbi:MAG: DVU_1557 family redox protein [Syntrophobacteraceae bacterium]